MQTKHIQSFVSANNVSSELPVVTLPRFAAGTEFRPDQLGIEP